MRKNMNATKHHTSKAALVWLPDVAAYRPNRAMARALGFQATIDAIRATRKEWGRALSYLLTGDCRG